MRIIFCSFSMLVIGLIFSEVLKRWQVIPQEQPSLWLSLLFIALLWTFELTQQLEQSRSKKLSPLVIKTASVTNTGIKLGASVTTIGSLPLLWISTISGVL